MKVSILWAGLTGLTAALHLADRHDVTILEKNRMAGGCLASENYGRYTLETLYHHCFSGDTGLFSLLESLSLKKDLIWLKGSTGYYMQGKLHPLTTPVEILKYPCLSFFQKAKLGLFVLSSRSVDYEALDNITAKEYLLEKVGAEIYQAFFAPLLGSKFGAVQDEVSAAWLMSRIAIRSDRGAEGERLGYLTGGWHRLTDAMTAALGEKQADIRLDTRAVSLSRTEYGWRVNGEEFDAVISTLPPEITKELLGNAAALPDIRYQGAACMTVGLDRDPAGGIYWTNMGEPAPYGAVVVHTIFVPREWYGEHVVYLASYFTGKPAEGLNETMLEDICKRFGIEESSVSHADLFIDEFAGPVYMTGYKDRIPDADAGQNLFIAGMFSAENYPERSMEGSVRAGVRVAELLENRNKEAGTE
jgi:protoporphyrinogen oxidase